MTLPADAITYKGNPCKRGHVGWRYRCGSCIECAKIMGAERRRENPELIKEIRQRWWAKNPERAKKLARESFLRCRAKNPERMLESRRRWDKANINRIRPMMAARNAARYAAKIKATPIWANRNEIRRFYENRPNGFHVDHIIPLKGKTVCGLHILENLQYLPALENCKKGNQLSTAQNDEHPNDLP